MGAFLAGADGSTDNDLNFRACYEIVVARLRGQGTASGLEHLVRRAVTYALGSDEPKVVDDTFTLVNYWGIMWTEGIASATAAEIGDTLDRLRKHCADLLADTDTDVYPVRAATLTGALAIAGFTPNWPLLEQRRGTPEPANVAAGVGVRFEPHMVDTTKLVGTELVDVDGAMLHLDHLTDLLPRARAYAMSQVAVIFAMFAPLTVAHPAYSKVRDGLDAATAEAAGDAATAVQCRDRGMTLMRAGKPLEALADLHAAKLKWYRGETMYGSILTMRYIAHVYADLGLTFAAKMYACTAATIALASREDDLKTHAAAALLEAAEYAQRTGTWIDAARMTEIAMMARARFVTDPFDFDAHPELDRHHTNSVLALAAIRSFWPRLEAIVQAAQPGTGWYESVASDVDTVDRLFNDEQQLQEEARRTLAGPLLSDVGPVRTIDFEALGVRWVLDCDNDRSAVLAMEAFTAALQVIIADIAVFHPVLIRATVRIAVELANEAGQHAYAAYIDDSGPDIEATVVFSESTAAADEEAPAMLVSCLQLLHSVHVRPPAALQALVEPMMRAGLSHKMWVGRRYQETAGLFDDDHYERCAAAERPHSSGAFRPRTQQPLAASTRTGPDYDETTSKESIADRYRAAQEPLRLTLPRLLSDNAGRRVITSLRDAGWLD